MASKGIAIRTILLLVVGVFVVVLVGYLVYRQISGPGVSCTECRSMLISFCTTCCARNDMKAYTEWGTGGMQMSPELQGCADNCDLHDSSKGTECHSGGDTGLPLSCHSVGIC